MKDNVPLQRTLALLRKRGYAAERCEQYVAIPGRPFGVTRDLFGVADVLAFDDYETLLVQVTTRRKVADHLRRYRLDADLLATIRRWHHIPGRRFVVYGWDRVRIPCKTTEGTKTRWRVREVEWDG